MPTYPDSWIEDPCCQLVLDWLDTTPMNGIDPKVSLAGLFNAPFNKVIDSLAIYLGATRTYISERRDLGNGNFQDGRRQTINAAIARYKDPKLNPKPTEIKYIEIMQMDRLPSDVQQISSACVADGVYLPHNHTRTRDLEDIHDLFNGKGAYPYGPLFDVQLLTSDTRTQLGEVPLSELYKTKARDLTGQARFYIREAKRLGILRAHPTRRLNVNPTSYPGEISTIEYGTGPNRKCCSGADGCIDGLLGHYCQYTIPGDTTSGCNALSDPC